MKTKGLFIALIVGLSFQVQGQETNIDSLKGVIATTKDSVQISALLELCHLHLFSQPDTALELAKRAYDKSVYQSRKHEDSKVYDKLMAEAANRVGTAHYLLGDFGNALIQWQNFLRINKERGDNRGIALAHGNLGIAHRLQGDLVMALKSMMQALKLDRDLLREAESISDSGAMVNYKNGIARHLMNIGIVYDEKSEYDIALEYYQKALQLSIQLGNKTSMAAMLGNIGLVYAEREDYEQALDYYFRAVKIDLELGNIYSLCAWYSNIGGAYQWKANNEGGNASLFDTSLAYYERLLHMAQKMESKTFIASGFNSIGGLYLDQGRYADARDYLQRSLKVSKEIGLLLKSQESEYNLSKMYARTEDYQEALLHFKEYTLLKDSLFNEDKSKEIGKLEARHEFEAAVGEREREEEEQTALEVEARTRSDNLQYSGILIVLVLLGAGVLALGKLKVSIRMAEGIIFFSFLLLFEFSLVLLDPYIETYSSGAPAIKLTFNAVLAALIFPLHSFFEENLKSRLIR